MSTDPLLTDSTLPPTVDPIAMDPDPLAKDSDLDRSWRSRVERLISGIPPLTRMVAEIHREILGELNSDRLGLRGDVRELKRQASEQAEFIEDHEGRLRILEGAPGMEALQEREQDQRERKATLHYAVGTGLGHLLQAAIAGAIAAITVLWAWLKSGGHHG